MCVQHCVGPKHRIHEVRNYISNIHNSRSKHTQEFNLRLFSFFFHLLVFRLDLVHSFFPRSLLAIMAMSLPVMIMSYVAVDEHCISVCDLAIELQCQLDALTQMRGIRQTSESVIKTLEFEFEPNGKQIILVYRKWLMIIISFIWIISTRLCICNLLWLFIIYLVFILVFDACMCNVYCVSLS